MIGNPHSSYANEQTVQQLLLSLTEQLGQPMLFNGRPLTGPRLEQLLTQVAAAINEARLRCKMPNRSLLLCCLETGWCDQRAERVPRNGKGDGQPRRQRVLGAVRDCHQERAQQCVCTNSRPIKQMRVCAVLPLAVEILKEKLFKSKETVVAKYDADLLEVLSLLNRN